MLKAKCMGLSKALPLQIVLPETYTGKGRRGKRRPERFGRLQDEATRAWNIHTAIYYKANGVPWRMIRDDSQLTTCFVGVSFYKTLDESRLLTNSAQVFNERGDGVIVRGGPAKLLKDDRQPHLSGPDACHLLTESLDRYWDEHKTRPAHIVMHKTSRYTDDERNGFLQAAKDKQVYSNDLMAVDRSLTRLFQAGRYPPLRGTFWSLDERSHRLYTRGSVDFFSTYPGLYVPRSLELQCDTTEQTPKFLAQEILALTKMNWNNTQFDGFSPITVRAVARSATSSSMSGKRAASSDDTATTCKTRSFIGLVLRRPVLAQQFRLLQHRLRGLLLLVRRVAVLSQDALDHHPQLRADALLDASSR